MSLVVITMSGYNTLCFFYPILRKIKNQKKIKNIFVVDYIKNRWLNGVTSLERFPTIHTIGYREQSKANTIGKMSITFSKI